jgi:hypothetical protein
VWVIPRLDVSFDVNAAWDEEQLARCWAAELARTLARLLAAPDDRRAVRFASRAEFVAAFLAALPDGAAWGSDRFHDFAGLETLPASAVIRTVLLDETEPGLDALAALTPSAARRVLTAIAPADVAIVIARLLGTAARPIARGALARAVDMWTADRAESFDLTAEQRVLWLLARMLASCADIDAVAAAPAAAAIVALDAVHAAASGHDWRREIVTIRDGCVADVAVPIAPALRASLGAWSSHPELLQVAIAILAGGSHGSMSSDLAVEHRTTAFGCVFWLLPLLDGMPAERWTLRPNVFRLAAFAACCPPELRGDAVRDALLRDLFGLAPQDEVDAAGVSPDVVETWMREDGHPAFAIAPDRAFLGSGTSITLAAHAVFRQFAWKLAGFGAASPRHLWTNCLDVPARVALHHDRIVATMARPPLNIVIQLAGLARGSYTLSRVDTRCIEFVPGD